MFLQEREERINLNSLNIEEHDTNTIKTLLSEDAAPYKLSKNQIETFLKLYNNDSNLLNNNKPLEGKTVSFLGRLPIVQTELKKIFIFLGAKIVSQDHQADYIFSTVKHLKKKGISQKSFSIRFLLSVLFKQTSIENSDKFEISKDTIIKDILCKCFIDDTHDGSNGIPTFFKYLLQFLMDDHGEIEGKRLFFASISLLRKYLDNLHCWRGFIFCILQFLLGICKNNKQKKDKRNRGTVYLQRPHFLKSLKQNIGRRSVKALNGNTTRATLFAAEIVIIPYLKIDKPLVVVQKFFNCLKELCAISYFTKKYQNCSKIRVR